MINVIKILCLILIFIILLERLLELILDSDDYYGQKVLSNLPSMNDTQRQLLTIMILGMYAISLCLLIGRILYFLFT